MGNGRLFFLGLNEFNKDMMYQASLKLGYKNIQKLFEMKNVETFTDDTYNSDYLEPWVQWVNIHTGKTSQEHKIKHLGDAPDMKFKQIWEDLSDKGIDSSVWGVLNGVRGNAENCKLFLPDPWTFSEMAFPKKYNNLLFFPRYIATNRTSLKLLKVFVNFLKLIKVLISPLVAVEFLKELPKAVLEVLKNPKDEYSGFCFVEYISSFLFIKLWDSNHSKFGMLFVNGIAHLQHYHWNSLDYKSNKKLSYGLYYVDQLLGKLFHVLKDEDRLIVANGLSQKNTLDEKAWIGYRAYSFEGLLDLGGIKYSRVESLMSYDAMVFFNSIEDKQKGKQILDEAVINGRKLFLVEDYKQDNTKLFFRPCFYDHVDSNCYFVMGGKKTKFLDIFKPLGVRTGRHIQTGVLFTNIEEAPAKLYNHKINKLIKSFFNLEANSTFSDNENLSFDGKDFSREEALI